MTNYPENSQIQYDLLNSLEKLAIFRRFFKVYSLCAVEICNEMHCAGLDHFAIVIFRLFSSFKLQLASFLGFNQKFLSLREKFESSLEIGWVLFVFR